MGNNGTDSLFYTNYEGAKANGFLVSVYHVVKPNQPADSQIARLFSVLGNRQLDLPIALDVERRDGQHGAQIAANVKSCAQEIEAKTGRKPIIYTARWVWSEFGLPNNALSEYDLWVANYRNSGQPTGSPVLPPPWQNKSWRFWQYSESGNVPGINTNTTDLNVFDGDFEALKQYAASPIVIIDPPPPINEAEVVNHGPKSLEARSLVSNLNSRSGPSVNYSSVGTLQLGQEISIVDIAGKNVWLESKPGEWSALVYEGVQYMTKTTVEGREGVYFKVTVPELNIRSGPGINYTAVGKLQQGNIIGVSDISGSDVWVASASDKWCALAYQGIPLMDMSTSMTNLLPKLVCLLREGDDGEYVKALQRVLKAQDFFQGSVSGNFGPKTKEAVEKFQRKANITVDGVVGPETWQALGGTVSANIRENQDCSTVVVGDAATIRRQQLADLAEQEGAKRLVYSVHGEAEKYLARLRPALGFPRGRYEWCAAFVFWCAEQVGFTIPEKPAGFWATMALVESWKHWAVQEGYWHPFGSTLLKRGDIIVFEWYDGDAALDHIGIALGHTPGSVTIQTAEGNASNRTGLLTRPTRNVPGFIRITKSE